MRAYIGLGLAVAVFSGTVFWAVQRLAVDEDLLHASQSSGSWVSVGAEIEYLRFLDALDRYGLGDSALSRDELIRRFDILWSRMPLMRTGDESRILRTVPGVSESVGEMVGVLEAVEPQVLALRPGDREAHARIRAQIEPFGPTLHDITLRVMLDVQVRALQGWLGDATDRVLASFGAVLLSAALLVLLLVRQIRASERLRASHEAARDEALKASQRLGAMAAELEDRVAARTEELAKVNLGLTAEVTERKKTAAALAESEQRFKTFAEISSDWMWELDDELRVSFLSDSFAALSTIPADELIGKVAAETRFEGDNPRLWAALAAAFERRTDIRDAEYTYVDRDGRSRALLLNGRPLYDADGAFAGYRGCATDVSEQRRAKRVAREHEAELARVMRVSTMGEMAATMAHELNQPLAAIVNYASGSIRRIESGAGSEALELRRTLAEIAAQAKRASKIIANIGDFTRKSPPPASAADINAIIRSVRDLANAESEDRGVRVRLELANAMPQVQVNIVEIEQVILNLLRNGIEASRSTRRERREVVTESRTNGLAYPVNAHDRYM